LDRVRQQCLRRFKKLPGVRQGCVQFKCSFVDPFGMDRKHIRLPNGLEYIDGQATWFRARRSINPKQLFPKFRRFPWQRLESDDHVKGQKTPPAAIMSTTINEQFISMNRAISVSRLRPAIDRVFTFHCRAFRYYETVKLRWRRRAIPFPQALDRSLVSSGSTAA